ncbi:MAG: DUF4313 domain-containing protein [Clostridia bacterium]|nr:DUF4313 domain-containing protein [Clostridia bacterium]
MKKNYKKYELEFYGDIYKVIPFKSRYFNNNTLAVILMTDKGEDFADITVNIEFTQANDTMAYIDTNNNKWVEKFLQDNKIAKPTGEYGFSGFCSYPLYEFDLTKLEEFEEN